MDPIIITAIVVQKGDVWVAQCLEYNLVSYANSLERLPRELMRQIQSQLALDVAAGREPFSHFKRAPQKYWDMLEIAKARSQPIRPKKSIMQHIRESFDWKRRIDAQLFPVPNTA
jgi:hypothetical protein